MNYTIKLKNKEEAERLVAALEGVDGDVNLAYGSYVVDAKSLLGVLSVGLGRECTLSVPDGAYINFGGIIS